MESRSSTGKRPGAAHVVVVTPHGGSMRAVPLVGERVTVGRLPDVNDVVLAPDPERLVTRAGHCAFERDGARWLVVDGGSVNGTFLRRGHTLERVDGQVALHDGDVVCVLAAVTAAGARSFFELSFRTTADSQATRPAPAGGAASRAADAVPDEFLHYDPDAARLALVRGDDRYEIRIRAQAHRLVRYVVERNAAAGGTPALCTHDELMRAVWADEPLHTRIELARLIWELRRALAPFAAEHLIESERRLGYRMRARGA